MNNVLAFLEASAKNYPDKTSFADMKNSVTFSELKTRAEKIGTFIALRSETRNPIAVIAEKSARTITAFMGIVYAGCFYVLLDPSHPKDRLETILQTLRPSMILVDETGEKCVRDKAIAYESIFTIEQAEANAADFGLLSDIRSKALDIDPLYTIFTSGSTGKPKGVVVNHRSVIDFISVFASQFGIDETDVIANQAPLDFDVSVKDIYSGLLCGARVELLPKSLFSFTTKLMDHLDDRKATVLIWAVSALCIVSTMDSIAYRRPAFLKKIMFSGETMPIKHLNYWRQHYPHATFVNLYGPTEITCNCTYYVIGENENFSDSDSIPIGVPFQNEQVFLLTDQDKLVAEPNVDGEICVSGTAVVLGYYNDTERTQQVFRQNPLNPFWLETIYCTGDLGYYDTKGLLHFKTRKDFQIKHMGHRIELQEIELNTTALPGVDRCCCIYDQEQKKIVAFYEGSAEKKEIINGLKLKLPQFMIPNVIVPLDRLPITKNGKIDRTALSRYQTEVMV